MVSQDNVLPDHAQVSLPCIIENAHFGSVIHEFPVLGWSLAILGALVVGMAKAGIKGTGVIIVMLLALAFESKASTGILMPLLITGDTFAVIYYNKHTQWKLLWRLLPWVILGVLIGVWIGKDLNEARFKLWMAILILGSAILMVWNEYRKQVVVPKHRLFRVIMGLLVGFSTMIGNLAGPFADLYFLAMRLPKHHFIGTAAWLFFLVNIFKLPFHIFVWHTITVQSFKYDLYLFPVVLIGLVIGVWAVARIQDLKYRKIVISLTAVGALLILLG